MKQYVWLDADPGFDDLITWLMLEAAPNLELLGVSVVAGNAPLPYTFANAVKAKAFFKLPQPVYAGRSQPLAGVQVTSQHLLGETGMASVGRTLPEGDYQGETQNGVLALIAAARAKPGQVTVVAIGPLTNLAVACLLEPELPQLLKQVLWMGGSTDRGNHTAVAEFNAFADPEAAELVLTSGVEFVMLGLNLTRQVMITPDHLAEIRSWQTEQAQLLADHLAFYLEIRTPGTPNPMPFHDPCAALWLICPHAFQNQPAEVGMELTGVRTRGMTVCEFRVPKRAAANALVVAQAEGEVCMAIVMELLQASLHG